MTMSEKYLYGGRPAEAQPAAGVKGVLIRTLDGVMMFRVYHDRERFTDYEIKVGERDILDHSPQVLGLRKIER
jgi:hypothetical protein